MIPSRMLNTNVPGDLRYCLDTQDKRDGLLLGTNSDSDANMVDVYDDFTVSAWIFLEQAPDTFSKVFGFDEAHSSQNGIGVRSNGRVFFSRSAVDAAGNNISGSAYNNYNVSDAALSYYKWHHICVGYTNNSSIGADDGILRVAVNGVVTVDDIGPDLYANYKALGGSETKEHYWASIGYAFHYAEGGFNGMISNLTYWNANLSQANMLKLHNKGRRAPYGIADSNLKNWWPLGTKSERLASCNNDAVEIRDMVGSAHGFLHDNVTADGLYAGTCPSIVPMPKLY